MTWEVMHVHRPPERATYETDPRIAAVERHLAGVDRLIPNFKAMHPMGATLSQECVTMMGEAMCTPLFHNQFRVPTYEDWVDHDADWSHVYTFHQRQLQHLRRLHVQGIAAAGEIHVVAQIAGDEPVVGQVVDPFQ